MPRLQAAFGKYPGGLNLLHTLLGNVRTALIHGLNRIFIASAVIMTASIVLHLMLKDIKLRGHQPAASDQPPGPLALLVQNFMRSLRARSFFL